MWQWHMVGFDGPRKFQWALVLWWPRFAMDRKVQLAEKVCSHVKDISQVKAGLASLGRCCDRMVLRELVFAMGCIKMCVLMFLFFVFPVWTLCLRKHSSLLPWEVLDGRTCMQVFLYKSFSAASLIKVALGCAWDVAFCESFQRHQTVYSTWKEWSVSNLLTYHRYSIGVCVRE